MNIKYIKHKTKKCCICKEPLDVMIQPETGKILYDGGNNAEPVMKGRCCNSCDNEVVLSVRLELFHKRLLKGENNGNKEHI
tara:strand:- start:331 stop:573 length:243 start_codon:yes stop_codon:yes gene_type:complete